MINKKIYLYILFGTFIIGSFHGLYTISIYVFLSWIFIGLWLDFTIKFLEKRKIARELNSPQNTSFFLFGPLFVGLFFNFWGYYTGFLGENLLEDIHMYSSWWLIIFAYPYLFYSLYIVYSCFTKFDVVYFKTKSFSARKFGLIITVMWIIGGIINPLFFAIIYDYLAISPIRIYFDLVLLIMSGLALLLLLVYGVAGHNRPLPDLTRDYIAQRRARLDHLDTISPTRSRTTPRATTTTNISRISTRTTPRGRTITRNTVQRSTTNTPHSIRTTVRSTKQEKQVKTATKSKTRPTTHKYNLKEIKPKAGVLSIDDFKCIFCFELPKLPQDQNRGIVICPHCRHPAHIDEFKDWAKNSNLCSRCDTPLPASFIKNPKTIPASVYLKAMKILLKKK
ncbi:MAG: hypothetical protein ACTSVV_07190 [Promethearchaeota archaeon]